MNKPTQNNQNTDGKKNEDEKMTEKPFKIQLKFQDKWKKSFTWLLQKDGPMYCSWCQEYSIKSDINNNFTKDTNNFKTSRINDYIIMKDHVESRDYIEKKEMPKSPSIIQPTIPNIFKPTREKLQYEMQCCRTLLFLNHRFSFL